jgi:transposase-like protein
MIELQEHQAPRRRSREEADRLVVEYEQSGLTRRAFCLQHGLSPASLDNYRKRHGGGAAEKPAGASAIASSVTFVPVELVERSSPHRQKANDGASLYIELVSGRRIGVTTGFDAATRIYVATGNTDMRLGFNGLYALVTAKLQQNPQSGHLFLFANSRRDRMKILFFDSNSLWVCARRIHPDDEDLSSRTPVWNKNDCIGRHPKMAECS